MEKILSQLFGKLTDGDVFILLFMALFAVVVLLIVFAIILDKLNIKRFSLIPPTFEFYKEGDTKITRIAGRKKTVSRRRNAK